MDGFELPSFLPLSLVLRIQVCVTTAGLHAAGEQAEGLVYTGWTLPVYHTLKTKLCFIFCLVSTRSNTEFHIFPGVKV